MYYGEEKRLQMARSILPSTWRGKARRFKQLDKRAARRRVAEALRGYDEELDEAVDLLEDASVAVGCVVWQRRGRDKVNPLGRWAEAVTLAVPEESRLSRLRGVLPRNLIGDHALLHLARRAHFRCAHERMIWERRYRSPQQIIMEGDARRLAVLTEVRARPEAWELLVAMLRDTHRTCLWPRARDRVVTALVREGRWYPEERTAWQEVGPRHARLPRRGEELAEWIGVLRLAGRRAPWVDSLRGPVRLRGPEAPAPWAAQLPNPEHHPEWLGTLDAFLSAYQRCGGDLRRIICTREWRRMPSA